MDERDVWRAAGARRNPGDDMAAELLAGAAGLAILATAMLSFLSVVLGWHLAG